MFNDSVDKILASFNKTIAKLEKHIDKQNTNIYVASVAKTAAIEMIDGAQAEKEKAAEVIVKLNALIS